MDTVTDRRIGERLRSAARIEPDRYPRLKVIGAAWAEAASAKLNATYASELKIEFADLSNFVFDAKAMEQAETQIALTVRSPKWRETVLVAGGPLFVDTVSEAAFGGDGRNKPELGRPLTSVGKFFADNALRAFVDTGNAVFGDIAPMQMAPDRLVTEEIGPKLDALLLKDARQFVEFRFEVSIGRCLAALRIAVPEAVLSLHKRALAVIPDAGPSIVDESWTKDLEAGFQKADMRVSALLAEHPTTLGEVACFQVGQTLSLNVTMESLLVLECEGQRLFRGHMGRSRDSYMVRIEESVDPTEEFIDDILSD
ncbi:FliM/FliN family flagellar motor switch protein [Aureimonas sp. AU40]|uniref:FliM/FliN family flagellar motor switch protein n=1 Tax=Aureimonas sp. AU40 TaxID=1637747 RepID=UPI0007847C0E|nr:FliM/FliN family flagellar motor switch protein [Aureimonas sp. AU40]